MNRFAGALIDLDGTVFFKSKAIPGAREALGNWRQFKWDADGNANSWTAQDRTHDKVNELTAISGSNADWIDPNYDAAGNMISGPKGGDPNTRLHFAYDAWGRLSAVKADSSGQPGDTVATYRYNGLNQRVRRLVGEHSYDYYYNTSWQMLKAVKDNYDNAPDWFVWSPHYIDALLYWDSDMEDRSGEMLFIYDARFNVTGLVAYSGCGNQNSCAVLERYRYDPYGGVTVLNGEEDYDANAADWSADADNASDWNNQVLYCGYRFDAETGLYYARNRYLHPGLGRWISRDRIGYVDGMDLYEQCKSNPANGTDPYGNKLLLKPNDLPGEFRRGQTHTAVGQPVPCCFGFRSKQVARCYAAPCDGMGMNQYATVTGDCGGGFPSCPPYTPPPIEICKFWKKPNLDTCISYCIAMFQNLPNNDLLNKCDDECGATYR